MLVDYMYHPVDFMQYSKTYYHWLVAERDLQKQISPSKAKNWLVAERDLQKQISPSKAKNIEQLYGQMIQPSALRSLEQHRHLCYKPLQRLMP